MFCVHAFECGGFCYYKALAIVFYGSADPFLIFNKRNVKFTGLRVFYNIIHAFWMMRYNTVSVFASKRVGQVLRC